MRQPIGYSRQQSHPVQFSNLANSTVVFETLLHVKGVKSEDMKYRIQIQELNGCVNIYIQQ
jgi:hypothetical protein